MTARPRRLLVTRTLAGALGLDDVSLTGGTATFADANAGTGKIVTLAGATLSGAAAGNYALASVNTTTADITKATVTITGNGLNGSGLLWDLRWAGPCGDGHVTGLGGVVLGQLVSGTIHTNVGIYSDSVTYTDGTGNYNNASKTVKSYILKASVTITGDGLNGSGYYGPMTGRRMPHRHRDGVGGVVLGSS